MGALLAAFGIKDIVYVALIALVIAGAAYEHHHIIVEGEAKALATLARSTKKLTDDNNAKLAAQKKADDANLASIEAEYANHLADSAAASATLEQRLRNYEAASSRQAAVPRAAAPASGSVPTSAIPGSVESAVEGVIGAASHDADEVVALQGWIAKECK
jgi:hypothetical protein